MTVRAQLWLLSWYRGSSMLSIASRITRMLKQQQGEQEGHGQFEVLGCFFVSPPNLSQLWLCLTLTFGLC